MSLSEAELILRLISTRSAKIIYPSVLLALFLGKLWLVRGQGIVGSATQFDALWYVRSAQHWYWGAPYSWIAFIRPCAYPLWIALAHLFHLPLRLAIELLQLGGALTLVCALRQLGISRWCAAASFAAIAFHPIGFQLNNYTMSDTFYGAILWYVLGGLLLMLAQPKLWLALPTGLAIALLWNSREEVALLVLLLVFWSAIYCWRIRLLLPIGVMLPVAILLISATYVANKAAFHSYARSEMTAPVYQSFFHSLLRIKPSEAKAFAPITMDTLHKAFEVSPTLALLAGQLDGPIGESWRIETAERVGTVGEIGAGWIVWAVRQAADAQGVFASPETARHFFAKAAREINEARIAGRLPSRFALDGFLDPFTQSGGLSRLPASARRVAARIFASWDLKPVLHDDTLTPAEASLYDEMTLRHGASSGEPKMVARMIGQTHWILIAILHLTAALGAVVVLLSLRTRRASQLCLLALLLVASVVVLRMALFAWLDATAFDGTQDRFLFPVLPLWSVALLLVVNLGLNTLRGPQAGER